MAGGVWQHTLVPSPGQTAHAGTVALLGLLPRGDPFAIGQGDLWLVVPSHPLQGCGSPVGMWGGRRGEGRGGRTPSCAVSQSWGHQAGGSSPCRIRLPVLPRYGRFYRCVALFHLPEEDENAVTAESLPLQQTQLLPISALLILLSLPSPSPQYPHEDPKGRTLSPYPHPHSQASHPRSSGHPPWHQDPGASKGTHPGVTQCMDSPCHAPRKAPTMAKKPLLPGSESVWEHEP